MADVQDGVLHESPHMPADPAVFVVDSTRGRVESLYFFKHRISADTEAQSCQGRQDVGETNTKDGADEAGDQRELRDGGRKNES